MIYKECLKVHDNPFVNFHDYTKYKLEFYRDNPFYFHADGLVCFIGPQGSGKTLSAVIYVTQLLKRFPRALLVTNLELAEFPIDNETVFPFVNGDDFEKYNNGKFGVIFLVDEIQLYFNSLASKNINPEVMTQISQQRKQRKHIVATSQVFGRMAKPLREQFSCVVRCRKYFGCLQKCQVISRDSIDEDKSDDSKLVGQVLFNSWYVHSPKYFNMYDTYKIIDTNKFVSGEKYLERYGNSYGYSNNF